MSVFQKLSLGLELIENKIKQWQEAYWWFRKRWLSPRNRIFSYLLKVKDLLLEAGFLLVVTWAICLILLYVAYLFWGLYLETVMGKEFCFRFPGRAAIIGQTLRNDLIALSIRITLTAFLICLGIAAVCRVAHIHRYFFMSLGWIGKLMCWGVPLTIITAYHIYKHSIGLSWEASLFLAALPTYCVFMGCFKYAENILPEMSDILYWGHYYGKQAWQYIEAIIKKIE